MTIDQIFECNVGRKTVWSKRGNEVSKRTTSAVAPSPRRKFEKIKEGAK